MGLFSKGGNSAVAAPPAPVAAPVTPPQPEKGVAVQTPIAPPPRVEIARSAQLSERQVYMQQLKVRIHQQLVERLDVQNLRSLPPETVRSEVRVLIRELCQSEKGLLNSIEQLPDPPAGSVLGVDNHPGATEVTTLPAAHVDRHLVSQPQRGDGRIQHRLVCARVDQRTQSHVPGDA